KADPATGRGGEEGRRRSGDGFGKFAWTTEGLDLRRRLLARSLRRDDALGDERPHLGLGAGGAELGATSRRGPRPGALCRGDGARLGLGAGTPGGGAGDVGASPGLAGGDLGALGRLPVGRGGE